MTGTTRPRTIRSAEKQISDEVPIARAGTSRPGRRNTGRRDRNHPRGGAGGGGGPNYVPIANDLALFASMSGAVLNPDNGNHVGMDLAGERCAFHGNNSGRGGISPIEGAFDGQRGMYWPTKSTSNNIQTEPLRGYAHTDYNRYYCGPYDWTVVLRFRFFEQPTDFQSPHCSGSGSWPHNHWCYIYPNDNPTHANKIGYNIYGGGLSGGVLCSEPLVDGEDYVFAVSHDSSGKQLVAKVYPLTPGSTVDSDNYTEGSVYSFTPQQENEGIVFGCRGDYTLAVAAGTVIDYFACYSSTFNETKMDLAANCPQIDALRTAAGLDPIFPLSGQEPQWMFDASKPLICMHTNSSQSVYNTGANANDQAIARIRSVNGGPSPVNTGAGTRSPLYKDSTYGGLGSLYFDGGDGLRGIANMFEDRATKDAVVIVVAEPQDASSNGMLFSTDDGGFTPRMSLFANTASAFAYNGLSTGRGSFVPEAGINVFALRANADPAYAYVWEKGYKRLDAWPLPMTVDNEFMVGTEVTNGNVNDFIGHICKIVVLEGDQVTDELIEQYMAALMSEWSVSAGTPGPDPYEPPTDEDLAGRFMVGWDSDDNNTSGTGLIIPADFGSAAFDLYTNCQDVPGNFPSLGAGDGAFNAAESGFRDVRFGSDATKRQAAIDFFMGTQSWSMSFWAKMDLVKQGTKNYHWLFCVGRTYNAINGGLRLMVTGDSAGPANQNRIWAMYATGWNGSNRTYDYVDYHDPDILTGNWQHFCWVNDWGNLTSRLYVDGVAGNGPQQILQQAEPVSSSSYGPRFCSGGGLNSNDYQGFADIDEIALFDAALSPADVAALAAGRQIKDF